MHSKNSERHTNPWTQLIWGETIMELAEDGFTPIYRVVGRARLANVVIRWRGSDSSNTKYIDINGVDGGSVWHCGDITKDASLRYAKDWAQKQLNQRTQDTPACISWSEVQSIESHDGVTFYTLTGMTPQGSYTINAKSNAPGVFHLWFFGELFESYTDTYNKGFQAMIDSIKQRVHNHYVEVVMVNLDTYNRGYFYE